MTEHAEQHAVEQGHQPDVIPARRVLITGLMLAMLVVGALTLMNFLIRRIGSQPPGPATYWKQTETLRANPDQRVQLHNLRTAEQSMLAEYSWLDNDETVARIPLARARELLLAEPLPVRETQEETAQ